MAVGERTQTAATPNLHPMMEDLQRQMDQCKREIVALHTALQLLIKQECRKTQELVQARMEDRLAMVERQLRTKILESQQRTAETIRVLQEELAVAQRSQEYLFEMVDTLEAMVGLVMEQMEAGRDAASSMIDTEPESADEPPPRTQPPILGPVLGPGPSTGSSGVRDSVMSAIPR